MITVFDPIITYDYHMWSLSSVVLCEDLTYFKTERGNAKTKKVHSKSTDPKDRDSMVMTNALVVSSQCA